MYHEINLTIIELDRTRQRIFEQLTEVERTLSGTNRKSPKRHELIERKNALLTQLREQKIRLHEARQVRNSTPRDHAVTDHALVRWLERKHGIDVDGLKEKMLTDLLRAALASGQEHWSDGEMVYVLKDGLVVTVLRSEWRPHAACSPVDASGGWEVRASDHILGSPARLVSCFSYLGSQPWRPVTPEMGRVYW